MPKMGFAVEANERGFFYGRTGEWIRYDSPVEAYIWSADEVAAILALSKGSGRWPLTPEYAHPGVWDGDAGLTVITGLGEAIGSAANTSGRPANVPDKGGVPYDIQAKMQTLRAGVVIAGKISL